jgi:hypothetical protein
MPHFLHVRSSVELDELIKAELLALQRAGAPEQLLNRSVLVRGLLTAVLSTRRGQPIRDERGTVLPAAELSRGLRLEVARELVQQVVVALERATNKALAGAMVHLPGILESELGLQPGEATPRPVQRPARKPAQKPAGKPAKGARSAQVG